jgi:hypothetical protein
MDDTRCHRRQVLAVVREFAGGRLEKQVLSRAYELAAPVVRVRTQVLVAAETAGKSIPREPGSQIIAKGA